MAAHAEWEVAFAFVARRSGTRAMPRSRWGHVIAFDLGWMNPGQARAYVDAALAAGLFEPAGDDAETLRLRMDPATVEVPRGFRPNPAVRPGPADRADPADPADVADVAGGAAGAALSGGTPDPFLAWVDAVAAARRLDRPAVLADVAALQARLGGLLSADAAVLGLAVQAGRGDAQVAAAALARGGRLTGPIAPAAPAR